MIQTDRYRAFFPRVDNLEETIEHFLNDLNVLYPDSKHPPLFNLHVKARPAFLVSLAAGSQRDPGVYAVTLTARRRVTRP